MLRDVFFVANADVLGVFTRHEVSVDSAPVFKVAPVSFVVGAGIGLRL